MKLEKDSSLVEKVLKNRVNLNKEKSVAETNTVKITDLINEIKKWLSFNFILREYTLWLIGCLVVFALSCGELKDEEHIRNELGEECSENYKQLLVIGWHKKGAEYHEGR